jgi:hypothetical protein
MRNLPTAINMTLDGFCDHTAMIADEEIHQHYNELLSNAGTLIYGRITYQLGLTRGYFSRSLSVIFSERVRENYKFAYRNVHLRKNSGDTAGA